MKSIIAFLFVCFIAFTMANPTPEADPGLITYGSPGLGHSLYYPYSYLGGYNSYPHPYNYGNVFRSGVHPAVYPYGGNVHHTVI